MAKHRRATPDHHPAPRGTRRARSQKQRVPKSLASAECGIRTTRDFAAVLTASLADILAQPVTVAMANAACNTSGKLLKVADMARRDGAAKRPKSLGYAT